MNPQQLREAVALAQQGRSEGYQAILDAYGGRLYGYFFRATRSHHDAEDLLGELMLRMVGRIRDYEETGRFQHWLFRIAANLVRDRIRRSSVRPTTVSLSREDALGRPLADRIAGASEAVERGIVADEMSRKIGAALDAVDQTTRQVILLRYFGEMSYREIADVLDCPVGTVLAQVHRGVRKLRGVLDDDDGP